MHITLVLLIFARHLQACTQYKHKHTIVHACTVHTHTHTHKQTPSVDAAVSTVGVPASDVAEGVVDVSLLVTGRGPESVVTVPVGG